MKKLLAYFSLAPSLILAHSYNRYNITADLLYWQAKENGQAIALSEKGSVKNPDFEWDIGFRIALGYLIPHDHWDLRLSWTHLNTDAHSHHKGTLFPTWPIASTQSVDEVKLHWRLHLGIVDLDLIKELRIGNRFLLRPFLGMRTAVIRQKEYIYYWGLLEDRVSMKNKFWGMGIKTGIDFVWEFSKCWNLYFENAVSQVFGDFHMHQTEKLDSLKNFDLHDQFDQTSSIVDTAIGLSFTYKCCTLKAAWENHLYMAQNQLLHFTSSNKFFSNQGDITLQGATLSFQYAF